MLAAAIPAAAEDEVRIDPAQGRLGWLTNPYRQRTVPAIDLNNSPRLESLVRAGNLYLTAPDVVALAIENNLDVEVQRYGPLLAQGSAAARAIRRRAAQRRVGRRGGTAERQPARRQREHRRRGGAARPETESAPAAES